MKLKDILTPTFKDYCQAPTSIVVVSTDSDFCRETVARGWLTEEQMAHAAERYQLGRSRSGKCIFWMIDELGFVHDGHIGNAWASDMLKNREPVLLKHWYATHCLFGLHLLQSESSVSSHICIVKSEASAVVLSELFPESLWMATVNPLHLDIRYFEPLRGHDLMLFPPTDETMSTYVSWLEVADQLRRLYFSSPQDRGSITVNPILEDHATASQKARHIDLLAFLEEGNEEVDSSK